MTKAELLAWIKADIVHRTDKDAAIETGLIHAHRAIQHEPIVLSTAAGPRRVPADWACQEKRSDTLTYTAGATTGISLPTDYKKGKALWIYDSTTAGLTIVEPGGVTTEYGNKLWNRQRSLAGMSTAVYTQRWFIRNSKLWLMNPPATGDSNISLKMDYYCWLPYYSAQVLTDWFSENAAEALGYRAACNVMVAIEDFDRAQAFRGLYDVARAASWELDQQSREAGTSAGVYRPTRWPQAGVR